MEGTPVVSAGDPPCFCMWKTKSPFFEHEGVKINIGRAEEKAVYNAENKHEQP